MARKSRKLARDGARSRVVVIAKRGSFSGQIQSGIGGLLVGVRGQRLGLVSELWGWGRFIAKCG